MLLNPSPRLLPTAPHTRTQPIHKLRIWNFRASTRSDAQLQGMKFLGLQGDFPETQTQGFFLCGFFVCGLGKHIGCGAPCGACTKTNLMPNSCSNIRVTFGSWTRADSYS